MMPMGTSREGLLGLFGVRRDGIKTDVGEEDYGRAGQHAQRLSALSGLPQQCVAEETEAGVAEGRERMPIRRIDVKRTHDDHKDHNGQLEDDDAGVEAGALLNSFHQDDRDEAGDQDGRQIKQRAGEGKATGGRIEIKRRVGEKASGHRMPNDARKS